MKLLVTLFFYIFYLTPYFTLMFQQPPILQSRSKDVVSHHFWAQNGAFASKTFLLLKKQYFFHVHHIFFAPFIWQN